MAVRKMTSKIGPEGILRFNRTVISESDAATFTELTVDTQLSIDRGVIWLIHLIEASIPASYLEQPAAAGVETATLQITRASQVGIIDIDDPDLIFRFQMQRSRGAAIGTDAGPLQLITIMPKQFIYSPPLAYAGVNLFIGILGSFGTGIAGRIRIGYTIATVGDREFFRVANAILS